MKALLTIAGAAPAGAFCGITQKLDAFERLSE
jgi:hypothetical protein